MPRCAPSSAPSRASNPDLLPAPRAPTRCYGACPLRRPTVLVVGLVAILGQPGCRNTHPSSAQGNRPRQTTVSAMHLGSRAAARPGSRAAARPGSRRRSGARGGHIPAPALRADVRVFPQDLALLPTHAALVCAVRPDLVWQSLTPAGWIRKTLGEKIPWAALRTWLGNASAPADLGMEPHHAVVVAAGFFDPARARALQQTLQSAVDVKKLVNPVIAPPLTLRARLVIALSNPAKMRAALDRWFASPPPLAGKPPQAVHPSGAHARKLLARIYRLTVSGGFALAARVTKRHLILDAVVHVSGPWGLQSAIQAFRRSFADPPPPLAAKPSATLLDDPFLRVVLTSGADLTVVVDAPRLAESFRWSGMHEALRALSGAPVDSRPMLLARAWHIASLPIRLHRPPALFSGFAAQVYLVSHPPQALLTWHLAPDGKRLVQPVVPALASRDLSSERSFIDLLLKPLAQRARDIVPPTGLWASKDLGKSLLASGMSMWALGLASEWPRFLVVKAARKLVLGVMRTDLQPGRFVRRVNVGLRGTLLSLRLEMRPASVIAQTLRHPGVKLRVHPRSRPRPHPRPRAVPRQ